MKKVLLMPKTIEILEEMGKQIRICRLRRGFPIDLICERCQMSRATYWKIEKGDPSVAMGSYAAALHAINGKDKDLLYICKEDELGRILQDKALPKRIRAKKSQ